MTSSVGQGQGLQSHGVTLRQGQLYPGISGLRGFITARFNSIMSVPGKEPIISVQISADFAHWYGWAHLQLSLIEIKEEARKLRELAKLKK